MNSLINKKVTYTNLGHIDYQKAWDKQENIFKKIIDVKIKNRKNNSNNKTENYIPHLNLSRDFLETVIWVQDYNVLNNPL